MNTNQLLELATQRHLAGDLIDARRLYVIALHETPEHTEAMFRLGLLEWQDGKPQAALPLICKAVDAAPTELRYHFGHGEVLAKLGRWHDAAAAFQQVLMVDPQRADAHLARGLALAAGVDHAAAIACYQQAVRCEPAFADAFAAMGNSHRSLGDIANAEAAYQRAIELTPEHAGALTNLGTLLHERARTTEAMPLLRQAVMSRPDVAACQINLAAALCDQRLFSEAIPLLQRALEFEPDNAPAACNLGNALYGLGKLPEAVQQFEKATALWPGYADAYNQLGNIRKELGDFQLAMSAYESAIQAKGDHALAMNNAGCLLRNMRKYEDAEAMLRRGIAVQPTLAALWNNLGNVLKDVGQLQEAIACFARAVELDPTDWGAHGNLAYSLSFIEETDEAILAECERWNLRHAALLKSESGVLTTDRSKDRRLRIGYVSPDFRDHCQSLFTVPLLSHHDHRMFKIYCYSSVERPDALTRQIAGLADQWREVRALDDAALADCVRADRIDILVDLTMHMSDGRPLLFARKPAPVQIAWLAYPGTTGMTAIDYRLSDPRLDPLGQDSHYSEKTIHLPDAFWCYDPLTREPMVNSLPALDHGHITFGCLNNPCKLTDHTLQLWARVMKALPTSQLRLMAPAGKYRQHLLDRLSALGIANNRVGILPHQPRSAYLKSYHEIDLGLDTFPYNGHTTSLDSLWMGVPVVTRVGQTCVGRGGLSQLYQLGMTELTAANDEAFVRIALELANDLPRLVALRKGLRSRMEASPLMDGKRFAANFEAVCRQAWMAHIT